MKKLLSLVLLACMMLSATALGAGVPVQDQMPPELISVKNLLDADIAAKVCNAQGEVIAEITENGDVILTDVSGRGDAEHEDIVTRLTEAYQNVMEDVHHSDVVCRLHEHDIKVDIDAVLGTLDPELDAHDLVMYELYDVKFNEVIEALLVDDAYVTVAFELAEYQPLPLIVLETANGKDWTVVPYTVVGEKQIAVNLYASSTVALLCDGRIVLHIGEEPTEETSVTDGNDTESESGNFTPSVAGKPAPELEIIPGEDGEEYVGVIGNTVDETKVLVPNRNYIVVTAPAESDYNHDIQTHEHLDWAYNTILEAEHVCDLPSDSHEGTIAEDLTARIEELGLELTCEELVVKELFEVSAYGDYLHYLYDENYYIDLTFLTDLDADKTVIVLHSPDSVHWHLHPIEESIVHENGKITLRMFDMGTVAILVEAADYVQTLEAPVQSPN